MSLCCLHMFKRYRLKVSLVLSTRVQEIWTKGESGVVYMCSRDMD